MNYPENSPFKLLQPYELGDLARFFGRVKETRQLTEALMQTKFILLYGASGTGKTSLIQCGLQGMFSPRDWMPIFVRRGNTNFPEAIREALREQYETFYGAQYPGNAPPPTEKLSLRELIHALFNLTYVPVYLILDQFEEIFTLGSFAEQQAFFETLQALRLFEEDLFCKLLIVVREEYIAHFYRFEKELPFLFDHRFRIEKMRKDQIEQVVQGTLEASYEGYPAFQVEAGTAAKIVYNLGDKHNEVDLTTLQVYLDRLYREGLSRRSTEADTAQALHFDLELIGENVIENVLADFLDQQLLQVSERIKQKHTPETQFKANLPLQVLFTLVTDQGTKRSGNAADCLLVMREKKRIEISLPILEDCLAELSHTDCRILNPLFFAKTGEKHFEIAHDHLAAQIHRKIDAEEFRYRDAISTIKNKMKLHGEAFNNGKKGEYLSLGELELVGQALNISSIDRELQLFHQDSILYHHRQKRKRQVVTIVVFIAALAFALLAWSVSEQKGRIAAQSIDIENQSNELAKQNVSLIQQNHISDSLRIKSNSLRMEADSNLTLAQINAELAVEKMLSLATEAIYHVAYDQALSIIMPAVPLGQKQKEVAKVVMEIAYFYTATENKLTEANEMVQQIATLHDKSHLIPTTPNPSRKRIHAALQKIDQKAYNDLQKRYYPNLVLIEGGEFMMGCLLKKCAGYGDDGPLHQVKLDRFSIAQTEITVWQWALFCKGTGRTLKSPVWGMDGDNPADNITWNEAILYTNWLSKQLYLDTCYSYTYYSGDSLGEVKLIPESNGYRLPTEAQWEYVAKGGAKPHSFIYAGSQDLDEIACWKKDRTKPVASLKPVNTAKNGQGLIYDMNGNVYEWCWDWYGPNKDSTYVNPSGPTSGETRVSRGGAYLSTTNQHFSVWNRKYFLYPNQTMPGFGFRIAKSTK